MFMTDGELALAMAAQRNLRNTVADAQRIIDGKHADVELLLSTIRKLKSELDTERARRIIAEDRLERILDMPI